MMYDVFSQVRHTEKNSFVSVLFLEKMWNDTHSILEGNRKSVI